MAHARSVAAAVFGLLLVGATAVRAEEPYAAVRTLQALQARIAVGDASPEAQAARMRELADGFLSQPADVWKDARNMQALATYLFNGGDPATVRGILANVPVPDAQKVLVEGALAHAEAQPALAQGLLGIDPRGLPADLGGHLALVQAALLLPADKPAALAKLDLARLLMPGSLVEEAALRRAMFLLGEGGSVAAFNDTVRRYRSRFAQSAYAGNFERRVATTVIERWPGAAASDKELLSATVEGNDAEARGRVWRDTARRALASGSVAAAGIAAAKVLATPGTHQTDRAAADLYRTVAAVLSANVATAAARLKSMDHEVPREDRDLWRAALVVADNIRAPMPPVSAAPPLGQDTPMDASIARAQALLEESER